MKKFLSIIIGVILSVALYAQSNFATQDHGFVHNTSNNYEWPTDPKILKKLDQWQELKFGIMFPTFNDLCSSNFKELDHRRSF